MPRRENFWSIWTKEELDKVPQHHRDRLEKEWNFRKECFERDNFTCQKCGHVEPEETIYEKTMEVTVHHVISQDDLKGTPYEYLIYDKDDGITFCKKCHKRWHKGGFRFVWKGVKWFLMDMVESINLGKLEELTKELKNEN